MTVHADASTTPLISVLLTAYNRESYIRDSIESVLSQHFTDFELIVVDDCSTDRTLQIAREYERADLRVRVFANERNLGDYPNRNHAATLARGEFIKYHDSDDVMYPHCLATMHGPLSKEPTAAFALSGACSWTGGPSPMLLSPAMCYEREFLGTGMFNRGPSNALFKSAVLRALGGFDYAGAASDYVFWLRACASVNVLLVPADLHFYRRHDGQELVSKQALADYASALNVGWLMLNSPDCPLTGEKLEVAKANFVFTVVRQMYWEMRARRPQQAIRIIRRAGLPLTAWTRYFHHQKRNPRAGAPVDSGVIRPRPIGSREDV